MYNAKICTKCLTSKLFEDFHKDKSNVSGGGLAYWCKECANKNTRDYHNKKKSSPAYKDSKRSTYFKSKFNLTLEEYLSKLEKQNYKCAICEVKLVTEGNSTHLDHDHDTGALRDFLCNNCNRGLGYFKDSCYNLLSAFEYLKRHNKEKK